jgi:hypothetical protein
MSGNDRGAAAPAPDSPQLTPREQIAQLRREREQAAPPPAPTHVLTLETLDPEPRFVAVDGMDHRMSFYDDLSLFQHARFARLQKRASAIAAELPTGAGGDLDDARVETLSAELDDLYGGMVRVILPTLPDDALGRLSQHQRQLIVRAFNSAQAERNARNKAALASRARPTGDRSSTPSPRASSATRTTGSSKRRSGSSSAPTAR